MKNKYLKPFIVLVITIIFQSFLYYISRYSGINVILLQSNIDDRIPLITTFVYFYVLWYLMLIVVPLFIYSKDKNVFYKYITCCFICVLFATVIFIFFPTQIYRNQLTGSSLSKHILKLIYKADTPAMNCFPSLHCIISFLFILYSVNNTNINIKMKVLILVLSILVIISTVLIKQHVFIDIIGALVIAIVSYMITIKLKFCNILKKTIEDL